MDFTDQMGRLVTLKQWPPRRIISLVPSQTEFLADLELADSVVGITKFCIHPAAWFQGKKRVGGTKTLDYQKIEALQPDLIIGNKEENDQSQIEYLAQRYSIWMSDIYTLEDALDMMQRLGALTGKQRKATEITEALKQKFGGLSELPKAFTQAAYLIWRKPFMVAAKGTFVDNMMHHAGFENVFGSLTRYPEVTREQLKEAKPSVILLSSEPYPFSEKHLKEILEICPEARIQLVDGELFSWYGSRLLQAPDYFVRLREQIGLK